MKLEYVVGTRASALALAQTGSVLDALRAARPEITFRVRTIRTTGDRQSDRGPEEATGIGFFVKELEQALLSGTIDLAVHSMKDMPTGQTPGLTVAAVTTRADPRDVLVSKDGLTLATLPPGARIGTSSPRRAGFLLAARPDVQIVPVLGNVETRVRRVDAGDVDAVCLAAAGLVRVGLDRRISDWLPEHVMLPAPGQGALGVQVRVADAEAHGVVAAAEDRPTRAAVIAERAMLQRLEGGCRLPAGAFARSVESAAGEERLEAFGAVVAPDGKRIIRAERSGSVDDAAELGSALADDLLARGAAGLAYQEMPNA